MSESEDKTLAEVIWFSIWFVLGLVFHSWGPILFWYLGQIHEDIKKNRK